MMMRNGARAALVVATALILTRANAAPEQRTFSSPDEAFGALVDALKRHDRAELLDILGSNAKPLLFSGDDVADARARRKFVDAHIARHSIEPIDRNMVMLEIGRDHWPFPIPLVKKDRRWRFDTAAGMDEVISRRIGRNELDAIQVSKAYVDAQREYAMSPHDGSDLPQYARKFSSDPGRQNGLYWETKPGEKPSPLGPLFANARAEGYRPDPRGGRTPYHGYFYRILTRQGPRATDGEYDYLIDGRMIGGFALVAFPATYGASGIMTFIVNHDGIVYQKDLGPKTAERAEKMEGFDPDPSWIPVDGEDLLPRS